MTAQSNKLIRHIAGYAVGTGIFVFLVPYGLFFLSLLDIFVFNIPVVPFDILPLIISIPLFITGVIFVVWSNYFLLMMGKGGPTDLFGVDISPQTKKLVVSGPYKYTRNPMIFGVYSYYIALSVYLNSLGTLIIILLLYLIIVNYIRSTEENRLLKDFGEEYTEYKRTTPMIFPFLQRKAE